MRGKLIMRLGCAAVAGLTCLCGKSEKSVVVVGSDTLKIEKIRAMMPRDTVFDSLTVKQGAFRYSLAKVLPASERQADSAVAKFGRRMTLLSGKEWSSEPAAVLLNAGAGLQAKLLDAKDVNTALALVDSLAAISGKALSDRDRVALQAMDISDAKFSVKLFSLVFGISEEEAATLANFIGKDVRESAGDIDAMVKDLLSAPEVAARERSAAAENPVLALKFRPQTSIRDSIVKHLPDLQQIYKKHLKMNGAVGGVVWVVFRVDAGGRVMSAAIKSSQIDSKLFLLQLKEYTSSIRFKSIPDRVGSMTFEFPFEFKPEL
jgi:hypothetical protein